MTIDVKGTKSGGPAVDPAERFALKEQDKLSAVPKGLALAFVGVALYLKSIFPAFAGKTRGAETDPVPEDPEPEGGSVVSIGTGQVVNLREERPRGDDDGGDVTVAAMAKAPTPSKAQAARMPHSDRLRTMWPRPAANRRLAAT